MPYNTNDLLHIDIIGDAEGQRIENSLDYRVVSASAYPEKEFAEDFSAHYDAWIFGNLTGVNGRIRRIKVSKYQKITFPSGKYKPLFSSVFKFDANLGPITGGSSTLPTMVVASIGKVGGGDANKLDENGTFAATTADASINDGRLPVSPIFEFATETLQPNKLTSDFRTRLKAAGEALMNFSFRHGSFGGLIECRMVVVSRYGPKQGSTPVAPREAGGVKYALFRDVTSITTPTVVGSQLSRKEFERFL